MSNPIDVPSHRFRVELAGGAVVEPDEQWPAADRPPMIVVRLPTARAHSLAHLLVDWATAFRLAPDHDEAPSTYALGRAVEDVAAALGDPGALACAS